MPTWTGFFREQVRPDTTCADKFANDEVAIRDILELQIIDAQQVISTACCTNTVGPSQCLKRQQQLKQIELTRNKQTRKFLDLHA